MQIVAHNLLANFSSRELKINTGRKAKSTEKLSSGYRINRAADDAAGLSISEKMRFMIRGLNRGLKNTMEGISFIQIGDGAMNEAQDMVNRMEELAVQAANGTNSDSDREALNAEVEQLKAEINHIADTTKFNEQMVFDRDVTEAYPTIHVEGKYFAAEDINVYNASYDDVEQKAVFGGIVFGGERISWDSIDPDMAYFDEDGVQRFRGGNYSFERNGSTYRIDCASGTEVPQFSRMVEVRGGLGDILYIGENAYRLSDFVDGEGNALSLENLHSGTWTREASGDTLELDVGIYGGSTEAWGSPLEAAAYAVTNGMQRVYWKESWADSYETQAVDTDGSSLPTDIKEDYVMEKLLANEPYRSGSDVTYRVRAAKEDSGTPGVDADYSINGIWLEEKVGGSWSYVTASEQSWSQVGLADASSAMWNSGNAVSASVQRSVHYNYYDGASKTTAGFYFELDASVTSLDSVIDGLDRTAVFGRDLHTTYGASGTSADGHVLGVDVALGGTYNYISPQEEYDFGRDYAVLAESSVATGMTAYDAGGGTLSVSMTGPSERTAGTSIDYTGETAGNYDKMEAYVRAYLVYVRNDKLNTVTSRSLTELVGTSNITGGGSNTTLRDTVTYEAGMNRTNGFSRTLTPGAAYSCAKIDFGQIEDVRDLAGCGFDSTCATCSNHYSVKFTAEDTSDYAGGAVKYRLESDGQNYLMKVDVNSLAAAGYTGANLASGLVDVFRGNFDFHYTQYAAKGSALYVIEEREDVNTSRADFYPNAYELEPLSDTNDFSFRLSDISDRSRTMTLDYLYDFSSLADMVSVDMADASDTDTVYEKVYDSDGGFKYEARAADNADTVVTTEETAPVETDRREEISADGNTKTETVTTESKKTTTSVKSLGTRYVKADGSHYKAKDASVTTVDVETTVNTRTMTYTKDADTGEWVQSGAVDASPAVSSTRNTSQTPSGDWYIPDIKIQDPDDGAWSDFMDSLDTVKTKQAGKSMQEMLSGTDISFNAKDYTKLTWECKELPNVAIASRFSTTIWSENPPSHKSKVRIQHSSEIRDYTNIPKFALDTNVLGLTNANCLTEENARGLINRTKYAQQAISHRRSIYGAMQNRLEHTYKNRDNQMENIMAAESRIRDTDISDEMVSYATHNILEQSGQSMLSQANQNAQGVLGLIQ